MSKPSATFTELRIKRIRKSMMDFKAISKMTPQERGNLDNKIGSLVERYLRQVNHPFLEHVEQLIKWVQSHVDESTAVIDMDSKRSKRKPKQKAQSTSILGNSEYLHLLFLPAPGISETSIRQHWRAQLLLLVAARSEHTSELEQKLLVHSTGIRNAANKASQLSVAQWSTAQFLSHLDTALDILDYPEEGASIQLDANRMLRVGDKEARLSLTEYNLLRLLHEMMDQYVSFDELKDAGINNPSRIMTNLRKKLVEADIRLDIISIDGSYLLRGQ